MCSNTSCRPTDAQDYTFRAFKVTSQVATPGAESAVCDCLVFPCGCDCTAPVFCILSNGRIINVHYNDDDDDDKVCQFSTTLTDAHYSMSYRSPLATPLTLIHLALLSKGTAAS